MRSSGESRQVPRAILVTQCLQNDFVQLLSESEALPNELHIGAAESRRLLGEDPRYGPLGRFLKGCYYTTPEQLAIIHLRDWHRQDDPSQREHLAFFGPHCLVDTPGAQFIPPLDELVTWERPGFTVDCRVLNDCEETPLPDVIGQILNGTARDQVRVGVIGVWTDVKINYLLYDLKTRLGFSQLGVCSALVASRHRRRHFDALEHFRQVLGVEVLDSVGEFLTWLGLGEQASIATLPAREQPHPEILFEGEPDPELLEPLHPYRRVVKRMFRNCREVRLQPLGGGFSGSKVFHARSVDSGGYVEAPCVVKLDRREQIARERVNYERVEYILGSNAPQVKEYLELGEVAGIRYMYASMGRRPVRTLKAAYGDGSFACETVLEDLWDILGRLYRHAHLEPIRIFAHYGFKPGTAGRTLARWRQLAEGLSLPDPSAFYQKLENGATGPMCYAYHSTIHGDLNAANVLLDDAGNMWIIDFFHTGYGHVLQDLAKLENDLKFILTSLSNDAELALAVAYEAWLASLGPLLEAPPPVPEALVSLGRLHQAVTSIRRFAAEVVLDHPSIVPYRVAQLRYAGHSLTFQECDERQKRWAAASVAYLARGLEAELDA